MGMRFAAFLMLAFAAMSAQAAQCAAQSGPGTAALVELYTSEGCSSCPPADRWLASLGGYPRDRVVPLALHVDYWDRLGWPDRFASWRFSERQYSLARQAGRRMVFTPGVFLNFQEFRGWSSSRFGDALRAVNGKPARADIRLELDTPGAQLEIKANFALRTPGNGQAFVALYENGLGTEVKAGENRGASLRHDYVVREWIGPVAVASSGEVRRTLALGRDWNLGNLGVAAFVQDAAGREVLQATALPLCTKG